MRVYWRHKVIFWASLLSLGALGWWMLGKLIYQAVTGGPVTFEP